MSVRLRLPPQAQAESAAEVIRGRVPARGAPRPLDAASITYSRATTSPMALPWFSFIISLYEIYFKLSTTATSRFNLGPAAEGHPGEML